MDLDPPTANGVSLQAWTQEYLNELLNAKVLRVSFLQPYLASNHTKQKNYVAHYMTAAASPALVDRTRGALKLVTPFGVPTSQPPAWQLQDPDRSVVLRDRYIHQAGKHFVLAQANDSGWGSNVRQKAYGIEQLAVFNVEDRLFVLGGLWSGDLLLIGG